MKNTKTHLTSPRKKRQGILGAFVFLENVTTPRRTRTLCTYVRDVIFFTRISLLV